MRAEHEVEYIPVQTLNQLKILNTSEDYEWISSLNYEKKIGDRKNVVIFVEGSFELCEECQ